MSVKSPTESGNCGKCNRPVTGEHTVALGKMWHINHFSCETCGKNITGDFFDHNGQLNCRNCAENMYRCAKCNRTIEGEYLYSKEGRYHPKCVEYSRCTKCSELIIGSEMVAIGKHFHPKCFTCTDCGVELPSKFYNREGAPVCESCSIDGNIIATICDKCSRPILSTYVSYEGKSFHDECFSCNSCRKILPIDNFYSVKGNPHCYDCATRLMKNR